jgi:superfamily I DNA/RNA helicase
LQNNGFENVVHVERDSPEPTLLDALTLILEDKSSNLGWRIVARCLLDSDAFEKLLKSSDVADPFVSHLDRELVAHVRALVTKLRHVRDKKVTDNDLAELLRELAIDPMAPAKATLQRKVDNKIKRADAAIRKIPIKVTTVQSSKGLAADLVVFANFDDAYLIKNKDKSVVSDQDVCNLVVALTRAKKKIVLISSNPKEPQFLDWIDKVRVLRVPRS